MRSTGFWGAQFLWQQASWESAVNQSVKEISGDWMIRRGGDATEKRQMKTKEKRRWGWSLVHFHLTCWQSGNQWGGRGGIGIQRGGGSTTSKSKHAEVKRGSQVMNKSDVRHGFGEKQRKDESRSLWSNEKKRAHLKQERAAGSK